MQTVLVTQSADAADLQWRRGRTPGVEEAAKAAANFRRDSAVRAAASDEQAGAYGGGPSFSSGAGQATLRSVVVTRDEAGSGSMRLAQLSQPGGEDTIVVPGAGQTQTDRDNFLNELQRSFGTQPEGQPGARPPGDRPLDAAPLDLPGGQPGDQRPLSLGPTPSADAIEAEQRRSQEVCRQELANLKTATLDKVILDINVTGTPGSDFPFECSIDNGEWHAGRCWPETVFMWKASALCHKPLYFEDEQMERYGHSWGPCCDPIVSGVHFFSRLPVLPYCMGVTPPCECVYALGHYRPGSCAPRYIEPIPISCRGALFQAGAVVGAAAILP